MIFCLLINNFTFIFIILFSLLILLPVLSFTQALCAGTSAVLEPLSFSWLLVPCSTLVGWIFVLQDSQSWSFSFLVFMFSFSLPSCVFVPFFYMCESCALVFPLVCPCNLSSIQISMVGWVRLCAWLRSIGDTWTLLSVPLIIFLKYVYTVIYTKKKKLRRWNYLNFLHLGFDFILLGITSDNLFKLM